jgi:hypothetical protein
MPDESYYLRNIVPMLQFVIHWEFDRFIKENRHSIPDYVSFCDSCNDLINVGECMVGG